MPGALSQVDATPSGQEEQIDGAVPIVPGSAGMGGALSATGSNQASSILDNALSVLLQQQQQKVMEKRMKTSLDPATLAKMSGAFFSGNKSGHFSENMAGAMDAMAPGLRRREDQISGDTDDLHSVMFKASQIRAQNAQREQERRDALAKAGMVIGEDGRYSYDPELLKAKKILNAEHQWEPYDDPKLGRMQRDKITGEVKPIKADRDPYEAAFDREDAKNAAEEIQKAQEVIKSSPSILKDMDKLLGDGKEKGLLDIAPSGVGAGAQKWINRNLGDGKKATAATEVGSILGTQVLEKLKSTFGGNPTEGERKILLDLENGAENLSVSEKKALAKRIRDAVQRKLDNAKETQVKIRSGKKIGADILPSQDKEDALKTARGKYSQEQIDEYMRMRNGQ